jgi:hypothetical protein
MPLPGTYLQPTAKATMLDMFLVKKYLRALRAVTGSCSGISVIQMCGLLGEESHSVSKLQDTTDGRSANSMWATGLHVPAISSKGTILASQNSHTLEEDMSDLCLCLAQHLLILKHKPVTVVWTSKTIWSCLVKLI